MIMDAVRHSRALGVASGQTVRPGAMYQSRWVMAVRSLWLENNSAPRQDLCGALPAQRQPQGLDWRTACCSAATAQTLQTLNVCVQS
jgi:hypothetical protein